MWWMALLSLLDWSRSVWGLWMHFAKFRMFDFQNGTPFTVFNRLQPSVTADIIAHQVFLNRVPEQATEDSVRYQIYY